MTRPDEIPIIDFAGVRAGDPAALRAAARDVHGACTGVGFFYIRGHGVPSDVIECAGDAGESVLSGLGVFERGLCNSLAGFRRFEGLGGAGR